MAFKVKNYNFYLMVIQAPKQQQKWEFFLDFVFVFSSFSFWILDLNCNLELISKKVFWIFSSILDF